MPSGGCTAGGGESVVPQVTVSAKTNRGSVRGDYNRAILKILRAGDSKRCPPCFYRAVERMQLVRLRRCRFGYPGGSAPEGASGNRSTTTPLKRRPDTNPGFLCSLGFLA